jgi:hypothetical protein
MTSLFALSNQVRSTENDVVKKPLTKSLSEASAHFNVLSNSMKAPGIDLASRLTAILTFGPAQEELLSTNFSENIIRLGEYVAGDEKLFHFTGVSSQVRLVPSKPDKIGLWIYELSTPSASNNPYLLRYRLHHNENGPIKVSDVIKDWGNDILRIGSEYRKDEAPYTFLAMDNYYMDTESRRWLLEKEIKFTASCNTSRFVAEVKMVHGDTADITGQHMSIYSEKSNELFTYHYDTQKGVGNKYNLSWGLTLHTEKLKVRAHQDDIPGYDVYKSMFETCDRFNRNLHDKTWHYKRGDNVALGHFGRCHDFVMGAILQNTFSLWEDLGGDKYGEKSFKDRCILLSDQLYISIR